MGEGMSDDYFDQPTKCCVCDEPIPVGPCDVVMTAQICRNQFGKGTNAEFTWRAAHSVCVKGDGNP